jgi:hypothetical protein
MNDGVKSVSLEEIYRNALGYALGAGRTFKEALRTGGPARLKREELLRLERNLLSLSHWLTRLEDQPISSEDAEVRLLLQRFHELVRSTLKRVEKAKRAPAAC